MVLVIQLIVGVILLGWWIVALFATDKMPNPFLVLFSIVAGLFVFVGAFGWTQVNAGQVGVVTNLGAVEETELGPGPHWRAPFIMNVTTMDTKVQVYTFNGIEAFTREQQPAQLVGVIQYAIDPNDASRLLQEVGMDYENKLIVPLVDETLKENARKFGTDQITAERSKLGAMVAESLRKELEPSYIKVIDVVIQNVGLSPEYLGAVEKRQQAQIEQERIEIEAETARQRAKGEADSQILRAQGQADSNRLITESLTPELIQWQAVEKLNPNVNVMMVPGDQGILINMDAPNPEEE